MPPRPPSTIVHAVSKAPIRVVDSTGTFDDEPAAIRSRGIRDERAVHGDDECRRRRERRAASIQRGRITLSPTETDR